jgi:hypothetical protein
LRVWSIFLTVKICATISAAPKTSTRSAIAVHIAIAFVSYTKTVSTTNWLITSGLQLVKLVRSTVDRFLVWTCFPHEACITIHGGAGRKELTTRYGSTNPLATSNSLCVSDVANSCAVVAIHKPSGANQSGIAWLPICGSTRIEGFNLGQHDLVQQDCVIRGCVLVRKV